MTSSDDTDSNAPFSDAFGWSLWAVTGAGAALAAISTIGVFVAPAAALVAVWLWRRTDRWQRLGFVAGVGLLVLGVGVAQLGANPCPEAGTGTGSEVGGCGGMDPRPWLASGAALVTGSLVLGFARHRRVRATGQPTGSR